MRASVVDPLVGPPGLRLVLRILVEELVELRANLLCSHLVRLELILDLGQGGLEDSDSLYRYQVLVRDHPVRVELLPNVLSHE